MVLKISPYLGYQMSDHLSWSPYLFITIYYLLFSLFILLITYLLLIWVLKIYLDSEYNSPYLDALCYSSWFICIASQLHIQFPVLDFGSW